MQVSKIKITDPGGLHLRRAADIVKCAKKYKSKISLCYDCKFADTCSILEVLALGAKKDGEIAVVVEGSDEKEAARDIGQLFSEGGGI